MDEPGLDLHEWETRWAEVEEAAADSPDEALPEMVRLIQEMLEERRFELAEPVTLEGEEADVVRRFLSAREAAQLVDAGEADPEDVEPAIEDLGFVYTYLITDRAPP